MLDVVDRVADPSEAALTAHKAPDTPKAAPAGWRQVEALPVGLFAAVMGTTWLGTVPLTSAAVARRFGVADLGALYGVCFFSHQIGGFIGAGAGAVLLDTTGSYAAFWPVMVVVGAAAVALNWATRAPEGRTVIA